MRGRIGNAAAERAWPALVLGLLAIAAFLGARGVSALVGVALAPRELAWAGGASLAAPSPTSPAPAERSARAILARNPFDSVTGSLLQRDTDLAPVVTPPGDPLDAPPCDGVRVLIIASALDRDGSVAALASASDAKPILRRRGDTFAGKTVAFIAFDRVWLQGPGASYCQVEMFATRDRGVAL